MYFLIPGESHVILVYAFLQVSGRFMLTWSYFFISSLLSAACLTSSLIYHYDKGFKTSYFKKKKKTIVTFTEFAFHLCLLRGLWR